MRIAIISDIHSNLEALTQTLKVIDEKSVDNIVCLGDIIGYGANPNECVELVRQRCITVIKGNHEDALENISTLENFTEIAQAAIIWTRSQLTKENFNYLRTLSLLNKKDDLLFVHASPCNPAEWKYIFDDGTAIDTFGCFSESLCFIGHTHTPIIHSSTGRAWGVTKGARYLVNVGSIGQPRDRDNNLSFGLFDTKTWTYENIRSPYDVETAVWKILKTDLPPKLAHRLLIGV
jgi:predicted phosphodiesterase